MNAAQIHTTLKKLHAVDIDRFEQKAWNAELTRVEQQAAAIAARQLGRRS